MWRVCGLTIPNGVSGRVDIAEFLLGAASRVVKLPPLLPVTILIESGTRLVIAVSNGSERGEFGNPDSHHIADELRRISPERDESTMAPNVLPDTVDLPFVFDKSCFQCQLWCCTGGVISRGYVPATSARAVGGARA